ncbi:hypothetical protein GUITHDRAFT_111335 [Guillardia theta CCMP2712]|uniref:Prolyl 4-hydroxylase alpha subunit domain-containing protein n=1 Tax=Guillardia theta (strain CCMP2712) TaxID=905079 RepID=L1J2W2_GUITC|nr:hypothetical protein GUITHDRAFT_111335 [Guillardia theta CCMP2712]EKX42657.1 hypothetical protein GUITHDRAFT_111335 [Guillardia theta CCMP2712]|eukprot:XP_005829637.1 hypothetical protein GUITHDRAFT_111335 [Guillardia theta CCMP2712]
MLLLNSLKFTQSFLPSLAWQRLPLQCMASYRHYTTPFNQRLRRERANVFSRCSCVQTLSSSSASSDSLVCPTISAKPLKDPFASKLLVDAEQADAAQPLAESIVEKLSRHGIVVVPNFVSPEHVAEMRTEMLEKEERGLFKQADIGRGSDQKHRPDVRGDEIAWINGVEDVSSRASLRFLEDLEHIRQLINRALFLGIFQLECHFASYSSGTFYVKHLDQFDLSELEEAMEVVPVGGTLVLFLSEWFPHEVLLSKKQRRSLTGWFLRRD